MPGFGRKIEHDELSWRFPSQAVTPRSVLWETDAPVLDQGELGSCTGNALAQCLNTKFFTPSRPGGKFLTEVDAVKLYSVATSLDNFPGQYPPEDTGTSGLAVCKAGQKLGYLTGYTHVFSGGDFQGALSVSPLIVGIDWFESMMDTDSKGFVSPSGSVVGGHEILVLGQDLPSKTFTFLNSWGSGWGLNGRFKMTFRDFFRLLRSDGDATTPVGAKAPTPPVPSSDPYKTALQNIKAIVDKALA